MSLRPSWASQSLNVGHTPVLIAHAGGNSSDRAGISFDGGADLVEVDIWSYRNRLETRHERRIPLTRVLFERWYMKWAPARHSSFSELLALSVGRGGVLLDFKNTRAVPDLLKQALAEAGEGTRVCASSQLWSILRQVNKQVPEMEMFYSIDVEDQLNLFLSIAERDPVPSGVSCNHERLDEGLIEHFHDLGLAVIAWTVDDPQRAVELTEWGVDAITTNALNAVKAELDSR